MNEPNEPITYDFQRGVGWVPKPANIVRMWCWTNVKFTQRNPRPGERFVRVKRLTDNPYYVVGDMLKETSWRNLNIRQDGTGAHGGYLYFTVEMYHE